jgi:protein SCO1/2
MTPSMAPIRQRREGLFVRLALGLALIGLISGEAGCSSQIRRAPMPAAIGGPFRLLDQTGAARDEGLLRGKWTAVFFGYTYCPDVCPTTLQALGRAVDRLGPDARRFQVVFITIDPARDTPRQLGAYLSSPSFPKGVIGLTGSPAAIAQAAKAYRVYYAKNGTGPGYTMDHTAVVYLMDPQGRFVQPLDITVPPAQLAGKLKAAMAEG